MKFILLLFLFANTLVAQWSNDATVNTPVTTAADDQQNIFSISDQQGGIIAIWNDKRNFGISSLDIYAQKFDKYGNPKWDVNGIPVCTATGGQGTPVGIHDGEGGAIIFWRDGRVSNASDIYAQRIDSMGNAIWTTDGVAICTASGVQENIDIISDNNNNAILVWADYRNNDWNIYIQKVNTSGTPQWMADGVLLCNATGDQRFPLIVTDGSDGAIVVWDDARGVADDIYAQKIDANGNMLWTTNGVLVCGAYSDQYYTQAVADGNGGAIVTWLDYRNDPDYTDVYAQKINSNGNTEWLTDGVPVSTEIWDQYLPKIVSDNAGGAIIVWEDWRSDIVLEYYAQRLNSLGDTLWAANGIPITNQPQDIDDHTLISDGANGAIITWRDGNSFQEDIYAQKISGSGNLQWDSDGVTISSAINRQEMPFVATDTRGGAIICWVDARNGAGKDIYAQQVSTNGNLGEVITDIKSAESIPEDYMLFQNYPNPFNPTTKIRFELPEPSNVEIEVFNSLGERVASLVNEVLSAGYHEITLNAESLSSGVYFYRLQTENYSETKKMILLR